MGDWSDWIGKSETRHDVITPGLLQRFCATIDRPVTDDIPQGLHWCLCLPDAPTAELAEDGHPAKGGFLPPVPLPRRMWASSDVSFEHPLQLGDAISRVSTVAPAALVSSDPPDIQAWDWQQEISPSETLLFRYSALTFNSHRIHYDRPYAMQEEAYPGLVVQGPLMATLLLDLATSHLGANKLSRFSFRGQAPAFANTALYLVGKREDASITLAVLGNDGREIMSAEAAI